MEGPAASPGFMSCVKQSAVLETERDDKYNIVPLIRTKCFCVEATYLGDIESSALQVHIEVNLAPRSCTRALTVGCMAGL